ncbi:MAG: hypothetical protein NW205_09000 [Hyphomicrobiaceae bacterium]|nr:hypothetical protein [Hyphomicrobiaceae bacterium]
MPKLLAGVPRICCALALVLAFEGASCGLAAQEEPRTGIPLIEPGAREPIALDETPEVEAVRSGRARHAYRSISERSRSRDASEAERRFLVAIDVEQLSEAAAQRAFGRARNATSRSLVRDLEKNTSYDGAALDAQSFETIYPGLNATLQCHWAYDEAVSAQFAAQDARAREAALEAEIEAERARGRPGAAPAAPESPAEPPPDPAEHANEEDAIIKTRNFTSAGRPCLLTVVCELTTDPRCDDSLLDQLVAAAVLVRTGD